MRTRLALCLTLLFGLGFHSGARAGPHHRESSHERLQQKPVTESTGDTGSGGPVTKKQWTFTGRMRVSESEITGETQARDLAGIEVQVSASDIGADGPWTVWGTTRTNGKGEYTFSHDNNGMTRFIRVQWRLWSPDLRVAESRLDDVTTLDLLDEEWRLAWKSVTQLGGPDVDVGTRVIAPNGALDLGIERYRRQALIWYVLRTAIDRLKAEDPWFAFKDAIAAIYPAHTVSGVSYANGLTRMAYLNAGSPDDDWHPDVALHEAMHLWNYDHNHGTTNWLGAVCSLRGEAPADMTTHNQQENPNVAFHEAFAEWASNALLNELWGVRKRKPLNRHWVVEVLGLKTLEMVEKNDTGVEHGLDLLTSQELHGWWSNTFGTATAFPAYLDPSNKFGTPAADPRKSFQSETGVAPPMVAKYPTDKDRLTLWELLRTMRAHPADGWPTDWQVGNVDYGLVRFIDRAADINHLPDDVRLMLKRCIDPLATDEPLDLLEKKELVPTRAPVHPAGSR